MPEDAYVPYDHDDDPEDRAPLPLDGAFWLGCGLITVFAAGVVHISQAVLHTIFVLAGL